MGEGGSIDGEKWMMMKEEEFKGSYFFYVIKRVDVGFFLRWDVLGRISLGDGLY